MKLTKGDTLRTEIGAAILMVALGCAAAIWLGKTAWIGIIFCALCVGALLLEGKGLFVLEALLLAAYALADGLTGVSGFSFGFLALGAGICPAGFLMNDAFLRARHVQKDLELEREREKETTLVSAVGQARNLRAYQNDAAIYLKLTKRYHLHLYLISWKLENISALKKQLREPEFHRLPDKITEIMSMNMRSEDMIYLLDEREESLEWGSLHITNDVNVQPIIEQRILSAIAPVAKKLGVDIRFQITDVIAGDDSTPMMMLEALANKNETADTAR